MDPDLFHNLLAEELPTIDHCRKYRLAFGTLRQIIPSEEFQQAARDLVTIEEIRTAALDLLARSLPPESAHQFTCRSHRRPL